MSNFRLLASQGLAGTALVLALLNDLDLVSYTGLSPRTTGIAALVLAAVAFVVAFRTGSAAVSGFLTLQGAADIAAAYSAGATIGMIFGAIPLALGLAKAAITLRAGARRATPPRAVTGPVAALAAAPAWMNGTYSHGWYQGGFQPWFLWWLIPLAGLALLVAAVVWAFSRGTTRQGRYASNALAILGERYARGEITKEQFEQMRREVAQR